jgi:hypothetical protein
VDRGPASKRDHRPMAASSTLRAERRVAEHQHCKAGLLRRGLGVARARPHDHRPVHRGSPAPAGSSSSAGCSGGSTPPDATGRHHGSSNARCPSGTSNAPTTRPGHSQPDHRSRPSTGTN